MQPATGEPGASPEPHPEDASTGWMWLGVAMPLGLGAWVPLVAGYRARHRGWIVAGVALSVLSIVAFTVNSSSESSSRIGGMLLIVAWVASGAVSFALRRPYARRMVMQSSYDDRIAMAEHIDAERRAMLALSASDPAKAAALGVGRPDLPGSRHGHLVDVNHAPAAVIAGLPGISPDRAAEIEALRDDLGGFDSVEDLGALMDLHPRVVEAMRARAVALPD
jgi:DNA uptake protein ComE-like DNA-binding protein